MPAASETREEVPRRGHQRLPVAGFPGVDRHPGHLLQGPEVDRGLQGDEPTVGGDDESGRRTVRGPSEAVGIGPLAPEVEGADEGVDLPQRHARTRFEGRLEGGARPPFQDPSPPDAVQTGGGQEEDPRGARCFSPRVQIFIP